MREIKKINIKNWTYFFCNNIIDLDKFDGSKIKVDKQNFNDIYIYYLGYEYKKKNRECNEINSVNPLYLRIIDMKGQFKKGKGAFGGTYFRNTYSIINKKWYKNPWKGFIDLKNIDPKFYASDYYDINVNKYALKSGTALRFWENKGWINKIDPYGWFQWYFRYRLGRRSKDDQRQVNRWKKITGGKLVKTLEILVVNLMISISLKIRQILLHWGYELAKKIF